jgi:putative NADH-flavin reductase
MIMWAIQILLALAVGAAGTMKLARSKAQLEANPHMGWVRTFSETEVKLLGAAQVLGATGVIVPTATGIAPNVARLAAACLAALMGGAVATHALRREPAVAAAVLALLAVVVAAFRSGGMSRLVIFGATGSLGSAVVRNALAAGHQLSLVVRTPSRIRPELASRASVHEGDLHTVRPAELTALIAGHDLVINCAGHVREGQTFVNLFDRVVSSADSLPEASKPVCWFLAGAALLDLDQTGRRAVQLPEVNATYWPHAANLERLQRSDLDWRLLCPGPMVDGPELGLERLRVTIDRLPVSLPQTAGDVPAPILLRLFAERMPEMIIPYADAASVMLANIGRGGPMMHHRVGIALPQGMRGHKE